jgi:2'-5' RNA ligase
VALAIEMYFDGAADAAIRSSWTSLAEDGLPAMDGKRYRPHVSFAVIDGDSIDEIHPALVEWVSPMLDVTLELSHVGRFPDTRVAFLGVTPTRSLVDLHEGLHRRLSTLQEGTIWDLYRPGGWVPHCTLAMDLDDSEMSRLLSLVRIVDLPIRADVVEVGLVEIPSGQVREAFPIARTT